MNSIYVLIGILAFLAALFGALWYGAYTENNLLKSTVTQQNAQINKLTEQYADLQNRYNALNSQYADLQRSYQDLNTRYGQLNSQYADLQNRYNTLRNQYSELQNKMSTLKSQYDQLQSEYTNLQSQYAELQDKVNTLKQYVYAGRDLVNKFNTMLQNIRLTAPTVGNSWTFSNSYTVTNITLYPGYYTYRELELHTYSTLVVSVSDPSLRIMIMDFSQFAQYRQTGVRSYLTSGYGSLSFKPSQNGTYYLVIVNDGSTTSTFSRTITITETWYYCDLYYRNTYGYCSSPHVVGNLFTPSHDFFKLAAIYNYWFNHRHELAQAVLAIYPNLTTVDAYTLSLAAVLKAARLNVTFAAVSTRLINPFSPSTAQVAVVFNSLIDPTETFNQYFNTLPIGGYSFRTYYIRRNFHVINFYVIINTYYVYEIYDLGKISYTSTNIIYLDGVTELP